MGADIVQYHIYDILHPDDLGFEKRYEWLRKNIPTNSKYLKLVETIKVTNEEELMDAFDRYVSLGYEGAIVRNAQAKYEHKRSYNLQKIKEFDDAEFKVVGIEEGRGKLTGHVGSFVCITEEGVEFKAKAKGEQKKLKEYFDNPTPWIGKKLTVQYQGMTGARCVPRFPIGIRFRQDS
jgi:ATP-dependent DNA ligase